MKTLRVNLRGFLARTGMFLLPVLTCAGVFAQNQPPTAPVAKTRTTNEDIAINVTASATSNQNLLSGFADPDGDPIAITDFTVDGVTTTAGTAFMIPGVGSVRIDAAGTYNFTPAANYNNAVPVITYTVSDGNGGTATGSLAITITPINDNIVNTIPSYNTPEDTPLILNTITPGGTPRLSVADVDAADPRGTNTITVNLSISYDARGNNPSWVAYAGALGTLTAPAGSDLGVNVTTRTFTAPTRADGSTPDSLIVTLRGPIDAINSYLSDPSGHPVTYTPPPDLFTSVCINSLRVAMVSTDEGNYGAGGVRRDRTTRLLGIQAVRDITNDVITSTRGTPTTFNVLTGTGGANADSFENPDRQVTAVNGTPVTSGSTITLPSGNTLTVNADGTFTFTAPGGTAMTDDSFTYSVLSGVCPETATVNVTITNPMPVTLVSFTGSWSEKKAVLDWVTSAELHSEFFEIQRAPDGRSWKVLGRVPAKGYSALLSAYVFTDGAPLEKTGYYRLKQVDTDGSFTYSHVISLFREGGKVYRIYPNPAGAFIEIEGLVPQTELVFYTQTGAVARRVTTSAASEKIDVSDLASGVYLIRASGKEGNGINFRLFKP